MGEDSPRSGDPLLDAFRRYWQFGVLLFGLGLGWATMEGQQAQLASDVRYAKREIEARLEAVAQAGTDRRVEMDRRLTDADARHDTRLTAVETRAQASELALATIRAELQAVRSGVDELVRAQRAAAAPAPR